MFNFFVLHSGAAEDIQFLLLLLDDSVWLNVQELHSVEHPFQWPLGKVEGAH